MKTITPEQKEQLQAIYNEYKESNTNYLQRQINMTVPSNLFGDISLKKEALGILNDLHYCIVGNASTITNAFSALLKENERMGCLTEGTIDRTFEVLYNLIRFVDSRDELSRIWDIYDNKEGLARKYEDDLDTILGEKSA